MLPEVYSLLMQSSVTSAAEQALSQSDERMRQAQHQLEVEAGEARRELEAESVERRAEVSKPLLGGQLINYSSWASRAAVTLSCVWIAALCAYAFAMHRYPLLLWLDTHVMLEKT
jgi:hypothetical protein